MANYADDCSPYEFSGSFEDVIQKLHDDSKCLIEWYETNYLKPNPEKWHLLLSEKNDDYFITIGNECVWNSTNEKILGVYFDNNLSFNTHLNKLCKKASQKLHALARVSTFMSFNQRKIIMNAFIQSQFSYCPLLWMCHSRIIHTQINKIHERALKIVYNDHISSFETLLDKSGTVSIHHRNLQLLAVELYKAVHNLSSPLMHNLFQIKEMNLYLRKGKAIVPTNVKTTKFGINSLRYLVPKIWEQIPEDIKNCNSLIQFKRKIKMWIPQNCPCRLCKTFVKYLGFL